MRAGRSGLICLLLLALACRSTSGLARVGRLLDRGDASAGRLTGDELRDELALYASHFEAAVTAAADEIAAGSQDPEVRRRALLWKLRLIPIVDEAAFAPEPEMAYVSLLTLATAMNRYLTTGTGAELFGERQPVAVAASQELEQAAKLIGARFLSPDQLARLVSQVEELVRENPMRGVFGPGMGRGFAAATAPGGRLDWVTGIPLAPFRALQGMDSGAQAIREFNETAQRFTQIVASLPQLVRWNLELLALDLQSQPGVESGLAAFESAARSAEALSQVAQGLPESVREQASLLVAQLDAGQGELRRTLEQARALVADAGVTGRGLEPIASALERTATELQQAGVAWAGMVEEVRRPSAGPPPGTGERPFDILEVERTATQVGAAATELRALVAEVRVGAESPELSAAFAGPRSWVNLAAWRLLQLILAFFACLFVFRRIEALLRRAA